MGFSPKIEMDFLSNKFQEIYDDKELVKLTKIKRMEKMVEYSLYIFLPIYVYTRFFSHLECPDEIYSGKNF